MADNHALMLLIEEALGHAGAAVMQRVPSDDEIIADHIEACRDHLRIAHKLLSRERPAAAQPREEEK